MAAANGEVGEWKDLSGPEKAAVVLNSLGTQTTALIFGHLSDNDVKRMVGVMQRITKAELKHVRQALEFYYRDIAEEEHMLFSKGNSRDFIINTVGEERARNVLGEIAVSGGHRTLEALEMVDSRTLSNFLMNEHPQTIALILAHLDSTRKCDVLRKLPENIQSEVVLRIAHLDFVSPELIAQLDDILKSELATLGSIDNQSLGGVAPVAEMLNVIDKATEQNIMARVEEKDPALAEDIRKRMFVFEDLVTCDDAGLRTMLREVQNDKLCIALKTASEMVRQKIFKNMSKRASEQLQEDLGAMGPVRVSDVEGAQGEIITIARRLEAEGKMIIARGGADDQLV